jgi:hypothetical protein
MTTSLRTMSSCAPRTVVSDHESDTRILDGEDKITTVFRYRLPRPSRGSRTPLVINAGAHHPTNGLARDVCGDKEGNLQLLRSRRRTTSFHGSLARGFRWKWTTEHVTIICAQLFRSLSIDPRAYGQRRCNCSAVSSRKYIAGKF